jgi:hypothetical protein
MQWVQTLERELRQTWALLTARQAGVVDHLLKGLGERRCPSQARRQAQANGRERGDGSSGIDKASSHGPARPVRKVAEQKLPIVPDIDTPQAVTVALLGLGFELNGAGMVSSPVPDRVHIVDAWSATPAPSASTVVAARLARERDEARAESSRLRDELTRLRKSAERLKRIRSERDRLKVERDLLSQEAAHARDRLAALELSLVEAEARLDDCRARASLAWEQQPQGHDDEFDYEIAEDTSQFELEMEPLGAPLVIVSERPAPDGTDPTLG